MKIIKAAISRHPWSVPVAAVVVSCLLAWLSQSSAPELTEGPGAIDTFIPAGFVLVPIAVQNSESLDAIFGNYGVVDLFATNSDGKVAPTAIVSAVKMLRAPKNPSQFGVLVPDEQASRLVRYSEPFFAVVHRPDRTGTKFEKAKLNRRRPVVYESEDP